MKNKYDLESLIKTFKVHSIVNEVNRDRHLKQFPDSEWAKCDFCISKALFHICKHIKNMEKRIKKG